jgi:predicted phosphoribosyltransferase
MQLRFEDRREAGRYLASKLTKYDDREDALVLGLPRGGIPVAFEVAHVLHLPLDVFLVRKLGVPGHTALRQQNPAGIVVAVPTASQEICSHIEKYVDEVVCAITPDPFWGVGLWYENFEQTTDAEVRKLLLENAERIKT